MSVNADILKKDRLPVWVVFGIKLLGFPHPMNIPAVRQHGRLEAHCPSFMRTKLAIGVAFASGLKPSESGKLLLQGGL